MESVDLPFRAEYAKSGRASCKACKTTISKDVLRMAVMVQSPHFDGKVPNWFHFECFFKKKQIKSVTDIGHFNSLRYEDQQRIKNKIAGGSSNGAGDEGSTNSEFSVDYAKSKRAECRLCLKKIEKGELRISKLERESETAMRFGPVPGWHHVDCFIKIRNDLEFKSSAKGLPGFSALSEEDQKELLQKIKGDGPVKRTAKQPPAVKKAKTEESSNKKKEENVLQAQSKLIFGYRDKLKNQLNKKEMIELLELNEQAVPSGESAIMDSLSDGLAFGALEPCPECSGQLQYRSTGYRCTGCISGWTKCQYMTKSPKRHKFAIPDDMKEEYSFLKKYKYVKGERIFPTEIEASSSQASTSKDKPKKPLDSFKIFTLGKLSKKKSEIETDIIVLGGRLAKSVTHSTTMVISTKEEIESKRKKKLSEADNIFVVSEEFLELVKTMSPAEAIKKTRLNQWGGDVDERLPLLIGHMDFPKSSAFQRSSTKSIQKVTVEGAASVDPDCELDNATVVEMRGDVYNAVLCLVDVLRGTNSYYKLQLLHDRKNKYYVFRSWGRVGTTIGSKKMESFSTLKEAINSFKAIYQEKTENEWDDRHNFIKQPNRFYPMDIDYGQEDSKILQDLKPGLNSKLMKQVQELICLIFDVEAMKMAMLEFEIDLQKMPLGKLSKKQIRTAYSVLTELQELLKKKEGNSSKILDATTRFYTLIPHDFGLQKPTLIDNEGLLKSKIEMLDSLMEIEFAYNLLKTGDDGEDDPIDKHYAQLKTDIEVLHKGAKEFDMIERYLKNTHAETHNQYTLNLLEVFKISRHGEDEKYKAFKNLHNKKLLWHGSRITNFAGILSQGLRIAPPEAPVTGYMFGKGVYFADMVSKSANYCFTNKSNPTGLLLLCEVALGDMYERTHAEFVNKLPKGKHSTKGLGRTAPNSKQAIIENGVEVPLGKPVNTDTNTTSLLYNEYIVYDVNQVNIKYLLKVDFKWRV